ncbi:MAG: energy transducer TonB, partial [Alistipes sp.]|nr:energy transducer TonB [Alistipes sp.]
MSVFKGDKAKEYAAELDLNISADDVKEGLIVITLKNEVDTDIDGDPLIKAEKMPKFQGGDVNRFAVWMQSQIQYPAEAVEKGISGRVLFSFVVEKDGSMSEFTVLRSPDMVLSAEVERVFNSAPKAWTAGEENGQKVRVKFTVPIVFTAVADSGVSKDFASLYAAGMADIAKADALDKEISGKKYDNQADYKADMQNVNDYYKSAMSALESAYALNPQHKPTVQSLYMIAFRLRDESGMMAKYEKYKAALQNL